jgi:hypothetical protein
VQQLLRRLCVPARFNVVSTASSIVSRRRVQRVWSDVVYELQCGLRVSGRIDVVNAASSDVYCREVQRVWRDVVQQL